MVHSPCSAGPVAATYVAAVEPGPQPHQSLLGPYDIPTITADLSWHDPLAGPRARQRDSRTLRGTSSTSSGTTTLTADSSSENVVNATAGTRTSLKLSIAVCSTAGA